jgi:hypothetical protein
MKIGNDTPVEIGSDGNGNDMLELYVVVTIPRGSPDRMSANLIGPIVVNNRSREAVQMVIADIPYIHKFPLIANRQEHSGAPDQNEVTEPVSGGKTAGEGPLDPCLRFRTPRNAAVALNV